MVDWFKSKGPGRPTRMNQILRRVMIEGKKRMEVRIAPIPATPGLISRYLAPVNGLRTPPVIRHRSVRME